MSEPKGDCVLFTGSRYWPEDDVTAIADFMAGAEWVIVGCCPTGVDAIVRRRAGKRAIVFRAMWRYPDGRKNPTAGPDRNQRMVHAAAVARAKGWHVRCAALPLKGSKGTWDCKWKLERHGFKVHLLGPLA